MAEHDFTIKIDDERLVDAVAERIIAMHSTEYDDEGEPIPSTRGRQTFEDAIRTTVNRMVRAAVEEQIKAITAEKITAAVEEIMAEGWQVTNSYGEPSGPRVTLRDRVSKIITDAQDGGWNGNRKRLIDAIVERKLAEMFDHRSGPIGQAVAEAQTKLKASIDGQVMSALNTTLRQALGLR